MPRLIKKIIRLIRSFRGGGFVEEWNEAISSDYMWQFEDMIEEIEDENPELAADVVRYIQQEEMIYDLVRRRLLSQGIYID